MVDAEITRNSQTSSRVGSDEDRVSVFFGGERYFEVPLVLRGQKTTGQHCILRRTSVEHHGMVAIT